MAITVLYHVANVKGECANKKMDHVTFACVVIMVMNVIYNAHIVLKDYAIKQMAAAPLDAKQDFSWTNVMQLVLKTVTKHVTKKLEDVLMDVLKDTMEIIVTKAAQKIVQMINAVKLVVSVQKGVRMDGWEMNVQNVSKPLHLFVFIDGINMIGYKTSCHNVLFQQNYLKI